MTAQPRTLALHAAATLVEQRCAPASAQLQTATQQAFVALAAPMGYFARRPDGTPSDNGAADKARTERAEAVRWLEEQARAAVQPLVMRRGETAITLTIDASGRVCSEADANTLRAAYAAAPEAWRSSVQSYRQRFLGWL